MDHASNSQTYKEPSKWEVMIRSSNVKFEYLIGFFIITVHFLAILWYLASFSPNSTFNSSVIRQFQNHKVIFWPKEADEINKVIQIQNIS